MGNLAFLQSGIKPNISSLADDLSQSVQVRMEEQIISCYADLNADTYKVFNRIEKGDFAMKSHERIFKVCSRLEFNDISVNKINELVPDLDPDYILSLPAVGKHNIEQLVRQFIESAVKRNIVELKYKINYDNKDDIEKQIIFQKNRVSASTNTMPDLIEKAKERNNHIQKYGYGLKTHLDNLNQYVKGFGAGQLIVIGGCTSMGKTALGVNIASHIAETHDVLFFSLEMPSHELITRMARAECGDDDTMLEKSMDRLKFKKLSIDDTSYLSIDEIEQKCYSISYKTGIDMVVIDYLQIMKMHKGQKLDSYEDITARLKRLSKELQVPIILISQLNRNNKDKDGKVGKPVLSNLRGSGSIEQDADVVMLIHRQEYYSPNMPKVKGLADIIVAKNRNGQTGAVSCSWIAKKTMFESLVKFLDEKNNNEKVSLGDFREGLLKAGGKKCTD